MTVRVETTELLERFDEISVLPRHALLLIEDVVVEGWMLLGAVTDLIEERKVEMKGLVVNENSRARDHGKILVQAAKEWAKTYGVRKIYLSCNIMRDRSHTFYLREEFSKIKTSHFFETEI